MTASPDPSVGAPLSSGEARSGETRWEEAYSGETRWEEAYSEEARSETPRHPLRFPDLARPFGRGSRRTDSSTGKEQAEHGAGFV